MVMDSMGICDTDLRERMGQSASISETQRLIKLLMNTLNRAITQGASGAEVAAETLERVSAEGLDLVRSEATDLDLRSRVKDEEPSTQDFLEVSVLFMVL